MVVRHLKSLVPGRFVPTVEDLYCWYKGLGDDTYIKATNCSYLPPATRRYQVGSIDILPFMQIGETCASDLARALQKNGSTLSECQNVLDFGRGCGRTLMWLRHVSGSSLLHGTDLNTKAIRWCQQSLPFATFQTNNPRPPAVPLAHV